MSTTISKVFRKAAPKEPDVMAILDMADARRKPLDMSVGFFDLRQYFSVYRHTWFFVGRLEKKYRIRAEKHLLPSQILVVRKLIRGVVVCKRFVDEGGMYRLLVAIKRGSTYRAFIKWANARLNSQLWVDLMTYYNSPQDMAPFLKQALAPSKWETIDGEKMLAVNDPAFYDVFVRSYHSPITNVAYLLLFEHVVLIATTERMTLQ